MLEIIQLSGFPKGHFTVLCLLVWISAVSSLYPEWGVGRVSARAPLGVKGRDGWNSDYYLPGLWLEGLTEITLLWYKKKSNLNYTTKTVRSIKTRSSPASLPFKGQVTEQTTLNSLLTLCIHVVFEIFRGFFRGLLGHFNVFLRIPWKIFRRFNVILVWRPIIGPHKAF